MCHKKEWKSVFVCRSCGRKYVYLKCLKNHIEQNNHCPVWFTYHSERSLEVMIKRIIENMDISIKDNSNWNVHKRETIKEAGKDALPGFEEYKEKLNNGGFDLYHVPEEELHQIYNIVTVGVVM